MTFEAWEAVKDPDEVKDYSINWSPTLGSDTISTSTWTLAGGVGLVLNSNSFGATGTTVWLSAGTRGTTYLLRNRITTVGLRTYDMTVRLICTDK